ncbi:hypothetical protein T11_13595 [Trichinella zimbabwensis]|uniref:Uncharacterized protein n=1 Tax=Trichinella zimbabwensis TaxID=268475 RepID=A0A0V1HWU7_9BILA|nr:hypothetical protein T11_13595 [Trichinella zimbabwensis]
MDIYIYLNLRGESCVDIIAIQHKIRLRSKSDNHTTIISSDNFYVVRLSFKLALNYYFCEVEIEQILHRCSPRTGPTRKAALSNSGLCASQPTK